MKIHHKVICSILLVLFSGEAIWRRMCLYLSLFCSVFTWFGFIISSFTPNCLTPCFYFILSTDWKSRSYIANSRTVFGWITWPSYLSFARKGSQQLKAVLLQDRQHEPDFCHVVGSGKSQGRHTFRNILAIFAMVNFQLQFVVLTGVLSLTRPSFYMKHYKCNFVHNLRSSKKNHQKWFHLKLFSGLFKTITLLARPKLWVRLLQVTRWHVVLSCFDF